MPLRKGLGVFLALLSFMFMVAFSACAEDFSYSFDSAIDVEKAALGDSVKYSSQQGVAGEGCIEIECSLDRQGLWIPKLENSSQGVLTFWIYDRVGASPFRPGFYIFGKTLKDGKPVNASFSMDQGRRGRTWRWNNAMRSGDNSGINTYIPRVNGWTRFDIVNPVGKDPQSFDIYINGRLAIKTPTKMTTFDSFAIKSFWGTGNIFADDISFNSDPSSFAPAAVQDIVAGNADGDVELTAVEPLAFDVKLDKKAFEQGGELEVELYDGTEQVVAKKNYQVPAGAENYRVSMPAPKHSGYYWIAVGTSLKASALPMHKLINVRFSTEQQYRKNKYQQKLAGTWQWLSADSGKGKSVTPPTDWSGSVPMKGLWYSYTRMLREYPGSNAWYHKKINFPQNWQGRKVIIDIDDPQSIATVFVGEQKAGSIECPGGTLDITKFVKFGQEQDLSIYLQAERNVGYDKVLKEIIGDSYSPGNSMQVRGLRGDVFLKAVQAGSRIDQSIIRTYTAEKPCRLETIYKCTGLVPGRSYTISANVTEAAVPALVMPQITFTAKEAEETHRAEAIWNNPKLWDIYQPNLYELNSVLKEDGGSAFVADAETFGMREVRFEGRFVTLNGIKLNIFHPGVYTNYDAFGFFGWMRRVHMNFLSGCHLPQPTLPGIGDMPMGARSAFCDSAGVGTFHDIASSLFDRKLIAYNKENDPHYLSYMSKTHDYFRRKYGNRPSVFFYGAVGDGNTMDVGSMYNPPLQDGLWVRDYIGNPVMKRYSLTARRAQNMMRSADPTRPIIAQDSGNFNDSCHVTHYGGFMQIQEFIEMNSYWIENGVKPIMYSEQAAPFVANWTNAPRRNGHSERRLIPYDAEWCGVTFGDKAFERTDFDNRVLYHYERVSKGKFEWIRKLTDAKQKEKALLGYRNTNGESFPTTMYKMSPESIRTKLWLNRIREQYLNWRADGIGLLCLEYENPVKWFYEVEKEYIRPITGFLAGPPENRYLKTHIFRPGETLERGVILLSNARKDTDVRYTWNLTLGGKVVASGEKKVNIPAGETLHYPVTAKIPESGDVSGRLDFTLYENAEGNEEKVVYESAPITVLAPRNIKIEKKIALIDPEGDSAKALRDSGIPFQRVPMNANLNGYDIVIFGRRAFNYELANLEEGYDLDVLLKSGKNIIILEQDEQTLRNRFKFRTEYSSPRESYPREFSGVLFDGLDEQCLSYWRGESTLTDGYKVSLDQLKPRVGQQDGGRWFYIWNNGKEHTRPMKWGNRHNVVTVVIYKPDTGNFRTLADCEFGLGFASAWQLDYDSGHIVFSQFDVSGRSDKEPAAERYLQNLVRYTGGLAKPELKEAVYFGGNKGAELLESLAVPFKRITDLKNIQPVQNVLVLGEADAQTLATLKQELAGFVENGGTVFSLCKNPQQLAALNADIKSEKRKVNCSPVRHSALPLLAGLGSADFYWKGNIDVGVLAGLPKENLLLESAILGNVKQGKGQWVFCQIDPVMFTADPYFFWLNDSYLNSQRTLRTLLSNTGIAMKAPYLLNKPAMSMKPVKMVDLSGEWMCELLSSADQKDEKHNWQSLEIPGNYRHKYPQWKKDSGLVLYSHKFKLDKIPAKTQAKIMVGSLGGEDNLKINGKLVGTTGRNTNPNDLSTANRLYAIPDGVLVAGDNTIEISVNFDTRATLSPGDGNIFPPLTIEFLRDAASVTVPKPLDLAGEWKGIAVKGKVEIPAANDNGWHKVKVPGEFDNQHTDWAAHNDYFWYKYSFNVNYPDTLPEDPQIVIGAVDDEDDVFVNGTLIGHTGADTNPNNYWAAERKYVIPRKILKAGRNEITIRVNDMRGTGGILDYIRILFEDSKKTEERKLKQSPYLHQVNRDNDPYMYKGW